MGSGAVRNTERIASLSFFRPCRRWIYKFNWISILAAKDSERIHWCLITIAPTNDYHRTNALLKKLAIFMKQRRWMTSKIERFSSELVQKKTERRALKSNKRIGIARSVKRKLKSELSALLAGVGTSLICSLRHLAYNTINKLKKTAWIENKHTKTQRNEESWMRDIWKLKEHKVYRTTNESTQKENAIRDEIRIPSPDSR